MIYFRILFYEFFNPRSVYFLVGWIKQRKFENNFEIMVFSSNTNVVKEMQNTLATCHISDGTVQFVSSFHRLKASKQYDYIEYNGGVSLSPAYLADLTRLTEVRTPSHNQNSSYLSPNILHG